MSCFFCCLGIRDRHRHSTISNSKVPVSQNKLVSVFLSEENEDSSSRDVDTSYFQSHVNVKELNNEAKFLKACGTIIETPIEIRKASQKLHGSSSDKDSEQLKCHSWMPHSSLETLQLAHPPAAAELCKKLEEGLSSSECTPCSEQNSKGQSIYSSKVFESAYANVTATDIHCRSKSVRFECLVDESSPGNLLPDKLSRNASGSKPKPSPYPTPLKLSNEMQTPGTVFPSNLGNLIHGKTQIRSQFVRSVLNPVQSMSQSMVLKEESNFNGLSVEMRESMGETDNVSPISEKDTEPKTRSKSERTPSERPIIGMVAAHWNEDEPTIISPKLWDGNGIPNSTNKYNEDEKVRWHATSFEERLEKALSEDNSNSQRIVNGKSSFWNEEESNRAVSSLQPKINDTIFQ